MVEVDVGRVIGGRRRHCCGHIPRGIDGRQLNRSMALEDAGGIATGSRMVVCLA